MWPRFLLTTSTLLLLPPCFYRILEGEADSSLCLTKLASRREVPPPLRDLSHGSTTSHGPPVIVRRNTAAARACLAKTAALLAQRLRSLFPPQPSAVPLLLASLPASSSTLAMLAGTAEVPRQRQRT